MADFDLTQSGQEIQDILNGAAMQTDLTAETERAEQTEQQLQSNIDIEETRAKAAEKQNADDIDAIEGKIPAAASSENQLATKAFVNSSIATATATYRGAYNLVSDLHLAIDATEQQIAATLAGAISTADNNDYCFVQIPTADATPTQIAAIERYKFNGTAWAYEYTLNNSGFTADQWAALNSGITTGLVAKLAALPTNDELTLLLGGKQDVLTFDNVPTEGSNNPVKSGGVKSAIDSEKERAQGAEQANAGNIAQVIAMIPAAASSENQLADKNFVNSSIATNTATYRGAFNEVSDLSLTVDATHEQIAAALAGAISTAENNDYCFVQVPTDDATPTQIAAIERYKFNGTAWAYEYTLNNSGFTADQWAAVNSGITSGLVAKLAALPTNDDLVAALAGKQPILTFDNVPTEGSNNPVKSGGVYAAIAEEAGTRAAAIAAIVALIPSAASALNQLADKAFVNSSISTATAVFKGTFNVVADLELNYNASQAQIALMLGSKIASADNNDYCFVQIPTSNETPLEIASTDRYKYNGTAWAYEYTLNNSGFTAAQWAAINSGITSLLKDKLIDLPTATELTTQLAAKQNVLTFDTTPTEGSTNPVTSDGIHAAINVEKERAEVVEETLQNNIDQERARALAAEQGLLDEYNELYALYQTIQGGAIIPVAAADWPVSNPQQNVIYRVANSATPTAYSDYMYNGTNTILLADFTFPGIDSEPTPDSTNLITSGGTFDAIMQNGPAFDLSAYNAVGDTLATYEDLSAALTALNALPAAYKKGGMSMKFVQTSDNKYVSYMLNAHSWTTNVSYWEKLNLEDEVGQLNQKTEEIEKQINYSEDDNIIIETDEHENVVSIDKNGVNVKALKVNNKKVLVDDDLRPLENKTEKIQNVTSIDDEECIVISNDEDDSNKIVEITNEGINVKALSVKGVPVDLKKILLYTPTSKIDEVNTTPKATGNVVLNQTNTAVANAAILDDYSIIYATPSGEVYHKKNDGTTALLLTIQGANQWRGFYLSSQGKLFISPYHATNTQNNGIWKLDDDMLGFTQVYQFTASGNQSTVWTFAEDNEGNLYGGVYDQAINQPVLLKSTDGGDTWTEKVNFGTLYSVPSMKHVHCIHFDKFNNTLYVSCGEGDYNYKSTDGGDTWSRVCVGMGKLTAIISTPYCRIFGNDVGNHIVGYENDDILSSKIIISMNDVDFWVAKEFWSMNIFGFRLSDKTGYLYAYTLIDSAVSSTDYFPPSEALTDPSALQDWIDSEPAHLSEWQKYNNKWKELYPEDCIRPQHSAILVSKDGGNTWDVLLRIFADNGSRGFYSCSQLRNGEFIGCGRKNDGTMSLSVAVCENNIGYNQGVPIIQNNILSNI